MSITIPTPDINGDAIAISYTLSTSGTPTYVPFAKIVDAAGYKITAARIAAEVLGSTSKKSTAGKPDYGDLGLTIVYDKALTALITGWMNSKLTLGFQVTVTEATGTASLATFIGWVKEFDPFGTVKEDTRVESKISIQITDVVTFTPGS